MRQWKWLGLLIASLWIVSFAHNAWAIPASAVTDRATRAEVRFLEGMMDHHMMAVDMANDCTHKAHTEAVRTLCQNIITAQTAEIKTMQGWLKDWYKIDYQPTSSMKDGMAGMDMTTDAPGMMGMMAGLNALQGKEYEIAWLESMIDHHDDALHMAARILKQSTHQPLTDLAVKITKDQSSEIQLMEKLITDLDKA